MYLKSEILFNSFIRYLVSPSRNEFSKNKSMLISILQNVICVIQWNMAHFYEKETTSIRALQLGAHISELCIAEELTKSQLSR